MYKRANLSPDVAPKHPGVLFKKHFLDNIKLDLKEAAERLGISEEELTEFINSERPCDANIASRLSAATGNCVSVWIGLQGRYDTYIARNMEPDGVTQLVA